MQHLIDVAVVQACEQLLHVALDLRHGEAHPGPVGESGEVVVHVLEDHVDAPLVLVTIDYFVQQQHDKVSDRRHDLTARSISNTHPQAKQSKPKGARIAKNGVIEPYLASLARPDPGLGR